MLRIIYRFSPCYEEIGNERGPFAMCDATRCCLSPYYEDAGDGQ
ncbi:hypothetical protein [Bacteroides pyogenes]|nr:hypothetical protein [Bacteroides pyogenes]